MTSSENALSPPEMTTAKVVSETTTLDNKKKKKPRYSKAKKRELKQQRLLEQHEEEENRKQLKKSGKKRKRTKSKANLLEPKDSLDRILQCAEKSIFTDSIVVENRDEVVVVDGDIGESSRKENEENDSNKKEDNNDGTSRQQRLIVEIVSGSDLSGSDEKSTTAQPKAHQSLLSPSSSEHRLMKRTICTIKVQPLLVLDLNGILCHRDRKTKRTEFWKNLHAAVPKSSGSSHHATTTLPPPRPWTLRPSVGFSANSAIIPRTDLLEFLRYLDRYFCLAIWTSAKPKTAKKLLNLLLSAEDNRPDNRNPSGGDAAARSNKDNEDRKGIRSRLLFVWSQTQCTAIRSDKANELHPANSTDKPEEEDDDERSFDDSVVFEKHLPKIWEAYPLWSANNTLLVDDSPEKCPLAVANAIHPPPLHGRSPPAQSFGDGQQRPATPLNESMVLSDQENEDRQARFFRDLVSFWTQRPHVGKHLWTTTLQSPQSAPSVASSASRGECEPSSHDEGTVTNRLYIDFLRTHARGYMGWREPTARND